MSKRTAATAAAGAAAPTTDTATDTPAATVHTSAQQPTPRPRDEYTGIGGSYLRDPVTGVRTRVPPAASAAGTDTAAA